MPRRAPTQKTLFDVRANLPNGFAPRQVPSGFVYRPEFLTKSEEIELVGYIEDLPLEHPVGYSDASHSRGSTGYEAKRRIINFGHEYDVAEKKMVPGSPFPPFLQPLRRKVAKWLDISPSRIIEALISEYTPGSAIGWHRDNEPVEYIVGISLAGWCRMRLRPYERPRRASSVMSLTLEPRSAYLMQKEARWRHQHSIPKVECLRYSITFRTLPKRTREWN